MHALEEISLYAGIGPNGAAVMERVRGRAHEGAFQLVHSPAFVKGIASGDVVRLAGQEGQFQLVQRSGNVAIRVFSRTAISAIAERLTPVLEQLGGSLDSESARLLVYSIHVSCGFAAFEAALNAAVGDEGEWLYGNVYSPEDGQTPLNWWQDLLQAV